jgi:GMP synthase (glutamine-hydrolysing)
MVEAKGYHLDTWSMLTGEVPDCAADYSAVIVFGGSMHVDQEDRFPWLSAEEDVLREVLAREVPILGVCLGAQLLAKVAGGRVFATKISEKGWTQVRVTDSGASDPVIGVLPSQFPALNWHVQTWSLAGVAGAVELAHSHVCPQAFRVGTAWGVQFHPRGNPDTRACVDGARRVGA